MGNSMTGERNRRAGVQEETHSLFFSGSPDLLLKIRPSNDPEYG
jgi:hypothetical protein